MSTDADNAPSAGNAPSHPFQAEVAELLHMMVHSVYSETDIFLRELISNASDACDKLRYEAIAQPELLAKGGALTIRITPDQTAGTLTISDSGIGMDRQELIDNLGTIARSGTRAFVNRLAEHQKSTEKTKDNASDGGNGPSSGAGLIGKFGVGFYSAFMVADRIEVTSRHAGADEAWVWTSASGAGFDIAPASGDRLTRVVRGTEIVLHMKPDATRFLETYEIERIVRTYSDHILFPIELVPAPKATPTSSAAGATDGEADAETAAENGPRQINTASAIWQRSKSELKAEDYTQAYRTISGGFDEPAMTLHYRAEGRQSYAVLLFAPSMRPFDLFDPDRKGRVKLYVRRVFITDDAELLPAHLRFIRGVIDSEDLPLNISREVLQNNPLVAQIRKAVTTRVVGELENLADKDPAAFGKIWEAFGAVLKEGIYEDYERRDKLLALSRFTTTVDGEQRTLKQYVADLKPKQSAIYYLVGDSIERLKSNPKLEQARARGVEVLLLTDQVDAFWTSQPMMFGELSLKSLSQGDIDFGEVALLTPTTEEPEKKATSAVDDAVVIAAVKAALGERVSDVRASQRLTDSPSCLVAGGRGPDRELDRLLARSKQAGAAGTKPILELNMRHPLVAAVSTAGAAGHVAEQTDIAGLLLDQAQILDGEIPDDPAAFAKRLNRLIVRGLPISG